jgi:hypothetical protein
MLGNFPLIVVSLAIYNMVAFLTPGVGWADPLFTLRIVSGADWTVTAGDALIALSVVFMFFEMVKAARPGSHSIVDHLLSTVVFVAALVEFLLVKEAGTSVFALLVLIAFVDVIGGWTISVRTARRDLMIEPSLEN